ADFLLVLVGLVIEVFGIGLGCDGGVNLALAGDAFAPPVGVQLAGRVGPLGVGLARDFPFPPMLAKRLVQLFAQWFQLRLELVPDDVDLGVVGDGLQRDV